jgi:adenylate cyclase
MNFMSKSKNKLYSEFEWEVIKSELTRTRLTIGVLFVALSIATINYFVLNQEIMDYYGGESLYWASVIWVSGFIGYEFIVLYVQKVRIKSRRPVLVGHRVAHIVMETSFPSIIIFYNVLHGITPILDGPQHVAYFIFIILSVLSLDFKLSFLTAAVASSGYMFCVYYVFHQIESTEYVLSVPENSYVIRTILMLMCGVVAGFVANVVKRGVLHSLDLKHSKSDLETLLGQQVSREVFHSLLEERGSVKKQDATVLALDIRNFTEFAELHAPDEIMAYQNKVFGPILDIVTQHQGVVNQILGDGIMATFGAPGSNPLHAEMAFQSALRIRKKVKQLGDELQIPITRIGIGLHTGEVVTGNIGNDQRKQFSISGTAVIIAFRVEQLNKEFGTEILITEDVKNNITIGRTIIHDKGPVTLKGLGKSVTVFQVE